MTNGSRPRIAVFSGATATIQNSAPLVTGDRARALHGLPPRRGGEGRFDTLRPQRLAKPVTVYVEQFSAHPLESDAGELYAPPDGYLDGQGHFHGERQGPEDVPVYEVTLSPEDGLYLLPYMARQRNGAAWEHEGSSTEAPADEVRQTFYPDASRIFEEIDRFGIDAEGANNLVASKADYDFFRAAPPAGYRRGLAASLRHDMGEGDVAPEALGEAWFPYRPPQLRRDPPRAMLARITNMVQNAMGSGRYAGGLWLEGSPNLEETLYWLNLVIDTRMPICGLASQRPHGTIGNEGDWNIVDAVEYIRSRIWAGDEGENMVGAVAVIDEQVFAARELQKGDARPGGYIATGGHGGIIGTMGQPGPPALTFRPVRRHTFHSEVRVTLLPDEIRGVRLDGAAIRPVAVQVKDADGELVGDAIPRVRIVKSARYLQEGMSHEADTEVEIFARIERNLREAPLAGFVAEGTAPYGHVFHSMGAALEIAACSGMPVVTVGRGNAEGMVPPVLHSLFVTGSNLTATKARLLLMACLLKFGMLPPAADPRNPTEAERKAIKAKLEQYQAVFDTH